MPIQDFKCKNGHTEEHIVKMDANPEIICKTCGKKMFKCFPKSTNFVLNGTGWESGGSLPTIANDSRNDPEPPKPRNLNPLA